MLNLWYAHLISGLDAEQREQFDAALWSDPEQEQALARLLA